MSKESKINPNSFFGQNSSPQESISKASDIAQSLDGAETEWQRLSQLTNILMSQMKEFYGITQTEAPNHIMQEQLNKENSEKLPMGLKMTQDGQNIDLGKWLGDKARMVGDLADDPKFAKVLKEKGKEFGFENMTGEKFKEIANQTGDNVQTEMNQYIEGTDAYESAQISDLININTRDSKSQANQSNFGMISGREKGGPITSGQPYLVGEKGPEMIIPNSSGQVITNNNLKSIQREHNIAQLNRSMARKKLVIQPIVSNNTHTKVVNRTVRSR